MASSAFSLCYEHAFSSVLAIPDLRVFPLLAVALHDMVIVASCKQQHEYLIVAKKSLCSSLALVFYCRCSLQYDIKK
jgi:hypothetical protein